ncbi:hypothetical protein [Rhodococcus erythropolis]|uniref:hypothetical protein n=1 Tax=Rhodococcus erythropolis TaxID=1833 RepID=UPI00130DA5D8|nr:hypothetical protein [Rhodococcus erythropolis]
MTHIVCHGNEFSDIAELSEALVRAVLLHSYAGSGRSGIFIGFGSAPVRPLTAL